MGRQRNGVDAAIALLQHLAARGGRASTAALAQDIQLPRASFHRISGMLRDAGVLRCEHGRVAVGPGAEALLASYQAARHPSLQHTVSSIRPRILPPLGTDRGVIPLMSPAATRVRRRFRIGFSNASLRNPWRTALVHAVEHAAARLEADIDRLTIRHACDDPMQQIADIRRFVEDGADGIIVSALSDISVREAISAATASGTAVMLVDRNTTPPIPGTSFVTADDAAIGHMTALWLAETMGGTGSVLMLPGSADAEPSRLRLAAAQSVFSQFSRIEVLPTVWTEWNRQIARDAVADILRSHGRGIGGVWCDSGLQAAGSIQAFIAANYRNGRIPPHTGGDLNFVYKLAIRHRIKLAALDYPPAMGMRAVESLIARLKGGWIAQTSYLGSDIIVTRGSATSSVRPTCWAEDHVRWDLPDELILGSDIGSSYDPRSFRVRYPGNHHNRSAVSPTGIGP